MLLKENKTQGSIVRLGEDKIWRLEVPSGSKERYRLAQLDDYGDMPRKKFPHKPPFCLKVEARASAADIPGTWGFGLWNNPFGMAIIRGVELLRLPALPNAAWFFVASPHNYLSLRDDLPANGPLAAAFRSPRLPTLLFVLAAPVLPLAFLRPAVRLARRMGRIIIHQDSARVAASLTEWHAYEIDWRKEETAFRVDGQLVLETRVSPTGPLGLVLWVDNQYAAFRPDGKASFGTLENPAPAWIELRNLEVQAGSV